MSWEKWVLVAFTALSALLTVSAIGKPRVPITPGLAAWMLVFNVAWVYLVVLA